MMRIPHHIALLGVSLRFCCLLALVTAFALPEAAAQQGASSSAPLVALVIGNGRAADGSQIAEPARDAAAVGSRLSQRGFRLIGTGSGDACTEGRAVVDADAALMRKALACFVQAASGARQAVLYFSGDSMIAEGRRHLVSAGDTQSTPSADGAHLDLSAALADIGAARPGLLLAIVDAERDTPQSASASTSGTAPLPAAAIPRMVLNAAPLGAPSERARLTSAEREKLEADAKASPDGSLSRLTRRLVGELDSDLDGRLLGSPGIDTQKLLLRSAAPENVDAEPAGEILVENVSAHGMLGRMPSIDPSPCGTLRWRATSFGHCVEIASAYEGCEGKNELKEKLRQRCPEDLSTLIRRKLRVDMLVAMKAKTCEALTKLTARFEEEPDAKALSEYEQVRTLTSFTCAVEAEAKMKAEMAELPKARDCRRTRTFLAQFGTKIEAAKRNELNALAKDVCCPEVSLDNKCVTRRVALQQALGRIERRGCKIAGSATAKSARAKQIVERLAHGRADEDINANGTILDPVMARIDAMLPSECGCTAPETLSTERGVCVCTQISAKGPPWCIARSDAAASIEKQLEGVGCMLSEAGDKPGAAARRFLTRLRTVDPATKTNELTSANFAQAELALGANSKINRERLCASFDVEAGLNERQHQAVKGIVAQFRDQPFAAIAVAETCGQPDCGRTTAVGHASINAARQKALQDCERKSKKCTLAASHRTSSKRKP